MADHFHSNADQRKMVSNGSRTGACGRIGITNPGPGISSSLTGMDEYGQDGNSNHVGIVEKVEDGVVYTVEGNSSDMCQENRYTVGYYEILGYGTPAC